jgi:hypothetical protein
MKPIFGVYDKSQRTGRYLLCFSESHEAVAEKAYHRFIEGATDGFHHDLARGVRWPALHGGLVVVDNQWACIYRFVQAKDVSADPRPLNAILMALVEREDIVGKDWRGVLSCSVFHDLAERLGRGDRRCPDNRDQDFVLAELSPQENVVAALEDGVDPRGFSASDVCAAVPSMSPERRANLVISDLRGSERLRLHAEQRALLRNSPAGPAAQSESPLVNEPRISTSAEHGRNARGDEADYSVAWMQLRKFLVVVGAPAAVLIGALTLWGPDVTEWWREPPFKRGNWYMPEAFEEGGRVFYDLVKTQEGNPYAFEMRSRYTDDPVELVSKAGEKRLVPRGLVKPRPAPPQLPNNQSVQRARRLQPPSIGSPPMSDDDNPGQKHDLPP